MPEARSWLYVGHTSQLANTGDYFTAQIHQQNVFLNETTPLLCRFLQVLYIHILVFLSVIFELGSNEGVGLRLVRVHLGRSIFVNLTFSFSTNIFTVSLLGRVVGLVRVLDFLCHTQSIINKTII